MSTPHVTILSLSHLQEYAKTSDVRIIDAVTQYGTIHGYDVTQTMLSDFPISIVSLYDVGNRQNNKLIFYTQCYYVEIIESLGIAKQTVGLFEFYMQVFELLRVHCIRNALQKSLCGRRLRKSDHIPQ